MKPGSVLIVGTGAMATYFAARLSAVDIPVIVLGSWPAGLATLNKDGARLEGIGSFPVNTRRVPLVDLEAHIALVLVKSWQTEHAAFQLAQCLSKDGLALTLQNGLGNDEILSRYLGAENVVRGVTTLGATLLGPGHVRPAGDGPISLEAHPRILSIQQMLVQAGFVVKVESDVRSMLWSKLVVSTAINPLTALLRIKNGELLEHQSVRELLCDLARETASVAGFLGIELQFPDPVRAVEEVALRTAENTSSMLQDILRGAPTEIDAINGAVVKLAHERKIELPVNRVMLSLIKAFPVRGNI
jgi:2-dehydropantoate 2-reductase